MLGRPQELVDSAIEEWRPRLLAPGPAGFARNAVRATAPSGISRARSLLWACGRLGAWGETVGLELKQEVLLHPSVTERFVAVGMVAATESARRTARANLRFVARRVTPGLPHPPGPLGVPRSPPKAPYAPAEIAAFFALAAAQPTLSRRQRLGGLLCLGLGAGLERAELRAVTGRDVVCRNGGIAGARTAPPLTPTTLPPPKPPATSSAAKAPMTKTATTASDAPQPPAKSAARSAPTR